MSASKKRQTMAKHARERAVKEKRALKLEKKRLAAEIRLAQANGTWVPPVDESTEHAQDAEHAVPGDSEPSTEDAPAQEEHQLA
jgi:hypothetical protein